LFAISREEQRLRLRWMLVMAAMIALSFMACTGEIKDPTQLKLDGAPLGGGQPSSMYGGNSPGGGSNPSGGSQPTAAANCIGAQPKAAPAPIARLTNLEYTNTLHSLLPGVTLPEISLPDDIVVEGFDNNAKAQTASPALIEQYSNNAEAVATAVTANLSTVMPCQASTSAQQDSCGAQFISQFVARAYRRPVTADETTRYTALFSAAKSSYDYPTAIGMVVQAALQSPSFLYRVELGGPAKNGNAPLTGYEMASRLSYFFWDNAPDQQLLAAAGSGELDSADGVEAEARRLLADPQAHAAVSNLFHQWLRFDKMDRMTKSATLFPTWNEQVAQSLRNSAGVFVDHVFWDLGGSLDALLTDNKAYVDANIAPMYGLTATAGNDMQLIVTDAKQRSGILTQAGLLAAFAHETADSPVLRGVFVMDRLLCSAPPPPPANLNLSLPDASSGSTPMTTRDRFAMTHEQGDCAGCHHAIDGFGFGFEHYDAVGKWRDTDNGLQVNAKGWIDGTRDANGDFDGAVELGQRLAQSEQVSDCVASQWFRYSLGLGAADVDTCALAPVAKTFADSGGDMQELMIATVTSDAFRNRPEVTQ
jgi:hypothetical protein